MITVTIYTTEKVLKQKPAYLLRPEPPKKGKKVLLERFNAIWNKLSFSMKITVRNISRYKKRVFMTLVGTAGCTFLIMLGLALKDSVNTVGDKQYNDLFNYDNLIVLNNNIKEINETLKRELNPLIKKEVLLKQEPYKVINDETSLDVYLVSPEKDSLSFIFLSVSFSFKLKYL